MLHTTRRGVPGDFIILCVPEIRMISVMDKTSTLLGLLNLYLHVLLSLSTFQSGGKVSLLTTSCGSTFAF